MSHVALTLLIIVLLFSFKAGTQPTVAGVDVEGCRKRVVIPEVDPRTQKRAYFKPDQV